MTTDMEIYAIIVAGGTGSRMQSIVPKQFMVVNGKPLLYHTVKTFLETYPGLQAIVVLPEDYVARSGTLFQGLPLERIRFIPGGETRFHSVKNGLQHVPAEAVVLVHDGVRCLVTSGLIKRCCEAALRHGNAIPAVNATDSIRIKEGNGNRSIDRGEVFLVQTPQTFKSDILLKAFEKAFDPLFTDEASVVEADGVAMHLVEGEHQNIKVTRPIDLAIVENLMNNKVSV